MKKSIISIDGSTRDLMRARQALSGISGVLAAEVVSGRSELRVFSGDELSESALMGAVTGCGVRGSLAERSHR